ncbi:MAG: nicotinate (nicotinamide) nucleotide adenylyltransferase [Lentisphaeria bacterium]|nr:nicotinate (nicotinamide) nucleotide adenylyltransferase [Lentisphaeria bacterium]
MKTAFFGGSFDPPHAGHLGVARGALASHRCDRVMWVPSFSPPHKAGREQAGFEHRMNMLRLLTAAEPGNFASDVEMRRQKSPSYTFELLEELNSRGEEEFLLLIGADSLLELHTWYRGVELAERFGVLTYPRPGAEVTLEILERHFPVKTAEKLFSGLLSGKFFENSSTNLRSAMAKSANWSDIISRTPAPVAEYCRRHGLYKIRVKGKMENE